jgi:hypothetical protein
MATVSQQIAAIEQTLASTVDDVVTAENEQNIAVFIRRTRLDNYRKENRLTVAEEIVTNTWGAPRCFMRLYSSTQSAFYPTGTSDSEVFDELWRVKIVPLTDKAQVLLEITTMLSYVEDVTITIEEVSV